MDRKCADPNLQLDVDTMTVDFLIHSALHTLLEESQTKGQSFERADNALRMVEDSLTVFNAHHPTPPDMPDIEFRLKILQFATLFCRRHAESCCAPPESQIRRLRSQNSKRARTWTSQPKAQGESGHLHSAVGSPWGSSHAHVGRTKTVTFLLDLLPMFMTISAMRADGNPSSYWMNLAAEMMLQAVLDFVPLLQQGEISETQIMSIASEAFAWGCPDNADSDDASDPNISLFWDYDNGSELTEWSEVKAEYLSELDSKKDMNLTLRLQNLRRNYPINDFNKIMLKYVSVLAASVEQPLLVQLQGTRITGLSEIETRQFKIRCGLST